MDGVGSVLLVASEPFPFTSNQSRIGFILTLGMDVAILTTPKTITRFSLSRCGSTRLLIGGPGKWLTVGGSLGDSTGL